MTRTAKQCPRVHVTTERLGTNKVFLDINSVALGSELGTFRSVTFLTHMTNKTLITLFYNEITQKFWLTFEAEENVNYEKSILTAIAS